MSVTSMNSRASLAGAFCCNWYPACLTKTGISIQSFRSADKYISHMLTHMDSDDVFDIADMCRDAASARPKLSMKTASALAPRPKKAVSNLTRANLIALHQEEQEEDEESEVEAPAPKRVAKKTIAKKVISPQPKKVIAKKAIAKKVAIPEPIIESEAEDEDEEEAGDEEEDVDMDEEEAEESEVELVTKKLSNKKL